MSKEGRHHYIPVFYLKQWARDNGRLCEFSKPHDRVKPRRTHPEGTGYVDGLNTAEGLPPADAKFLEDVFFQIADDAAARALKVLFTPPPWTLTPKERSGWSRFIMALLVRNPESMQKIQRGRRSNAKKHSRVSRPLTQRTAGRVILRHTLSTRSFTVQILLPAPLCEPFKPSLITPNLGAG